MDQPISELQYDNGEGAENSQIGAMGSCVKFSCATTNIIRTHVATSGHPILAMATQREIAGGGGGTQKAKVLPQGDKSAVLRQKNTVEGSSIKLLSRVEQLRLLTKAEKAGLLSAAENFGLSLSAIEKLGLLSKAEEFGILSAATDPNTPGFLLNLAVVLLLAGPLCVYLVPEDSVWEIVLQVIVALLSVVGGPAAFAGCNFVSMLQKSN